MAAPMPCDAPVMRMTGVVMTGKASHRDARPTKEKHFH